MSFLENDSIINEQDILSILVATDTHIGFAERDALRQHDSFNTFEEILQIAQKYEVDMILFGGDLFHDNKPSRRAIHDTIFLMRKYCLGERECHLDLVSDPLVNFGHCQFKHANYHDPNLNIAYPIFSIHGNHDDPTGEQHLSAIDILSTSGLLNHFGKSMSCDDIEISPVLLKKGATKLALFGLGAMRDERLHRNFIQKKVKMLRPKEDENSWFNLFVIHQNRAKHGEKNYIPESFLDDFIDLVIWGHEHECLIEPTWSTSAKNFFVSQPGSSVATSLSEGESKQKYVGILQVHKKSFKMEKVPLKTVRQFLMDDIVLGETCIKPYEDEQVLSYLTEKVELMIQEAEETHTKHPKQPPLPLIRIKVEYSGGYNIINPHRFGQQFVGRVANNKDILLFYRKKTNLNKDRNEKSTGVNLPFSQASSLKMEDLINEYLNAVDEKLQLDILSERKLSKALNEFILKDEKDAIPLLVRDQLNKAQKKLVNKNLKEDSIVAEISRLKADEKVVDEFAEDKEINEILSQSRNRVTNDITERIEDAESDGDGSSMVVESEARPLRGRGSRGGRGSRLKTKATITPVRKSRGRGGSSQMQLTMQESFISTARRTANNNTIHLGDHDDVMASGSFVKEKNSSTFFETISSDDDSDPFSMQPSKIKQR